MFQRSLDLPGQFGVVFDDQNAHDFPRNDEA
jgi:hypothetical protein